MRICQECGKPLVGRQLKYCVECRWKIKAMHQREYRKIKSEERKKETEGSNENICVDCGAEFFDKRSHRCPKCREERKKRLEQEWQERNGERRKMNSRFCPTCGAAYISGGISVCPECAKTETEMLRNSVRTEKKIIEMPSKWRKKYPNEMEAGVRWRQHLLSEDLKKAREAGLSYGQAVARGVI